MSYNGGSEGGREEREGGREEREGGREEREGGTSRVLFSSDTHHTGTRF